jgi:Uma2 family endonuclease
MVTLVTPTDAAPVIGPPQGHWTAADWEHLPDDGNRYEIIAGVLYMSTSPSYFHQWIIKQMYRLLGVPAEANGWAYCDFAPIGLLMPGCDPVQPDLVVVLRERAAIIRNRRIMGVPDLIVEVMSPGSMSYDQDVKRDAYESAGVPEYALVNPRERLLLYTLQADHRYGLPQKFGENDTLTFACLPGISIRVGDLFAGSPDTTL